VIDGPEGSEAKELGQVIRIGLVSLATVPLLAPAIADQNGVDPVHQEVIEPLGLGALLEGHMDGPTHAPKELEDGRFFGGEDTSRNDPAVFFPDRDYGHCLVNVESHILG
jgi:hypothetical protein